MHRRHCFIYLVGLVVCAIRQNLATSSSESSRSTRIKSLLESKFAEKCDSVVRLTQEAKENLQAELREASQKNMHYSQLILIAIFLDLKSNYVFDDDPSINPFGFVFRPTYNVDILRDGFTFIYGIADAYPAFPSVMAQPSPTVNCGRPQLVAMLLNRIKDGSEFESKLRMELDCLLQYEASNLSAFELKAALDEALKAAEVLKELQKKRLRDK